MSQPGQANAFEQEGRDEEDRASEDDEIPRLDPRMVEEEDNKDFWEGLDDEVVAENGRTFLTPGGSASQAIEEEVGAPLFEEEGRPARVRGAPREPGKKEREEHEATHVPYAPWCKFCVMGRGR